MYLILFIGIFLAYELQRFVMKRCWDQGLTVRLRFRDTCIYEGDTSVLQVEVTNEKRLPVPAMEVRIAMRAQLVFSGEAAGNSRISDQTSKRDVFSLLMRQQITRNLTFVGRKRGCYRITEADVKGYNFFYQECGYRTLPQDTMLYVYPAQVDARRIRTICTAISGSVLVQSQVFPDPFEFSGIREYVPTDPANRINWKATMRSMTPMVNQYDSTSNLNLALVFDLEDSHIIKEEALVEETIRIVSSLSAYLSQNRMTVTLYGNAQIPGQDGMFRQEITYGSGRIAHLNEQLACINGVSMGTLDLLAQIKPASEQMMIFISKNLEQEVTEALTALSAPTRPVIWVVPVHAGEETRVPENGSVQIQLWELEG